MRSKQERNQIITGEEKGRLRNHWNRSEFFELCPEADGTQNR